MDEGIRQPPCDRPDLAVLLARGEDLSSPQRKELAAHAAGCPRCGPALRLLRSAERWLAGRAGPGACPEADVLYDFGGGPGSTPLPAERRVELERHVASCTACRELVATLEVPPPQPLLDVGPEPEARWRAGADELEAAGPGPRPVGPAREPWWAGRPTWSRVLPLAAAALLAVTAILLDPAWIADAGGEFRFPEAPLLRGPGLSPLRFPSGPLLALDKESGGSATYSPVRFELHPVDDAERYRIVLRRHDGGAFAEGEAIAELESELPDVETSLSLEPGRYTWEAWALRRGLERPLGARDFQVVEDAALLAELRRLDRVRDPERTQRCLLLLHERGFLTDARALARRLPPSPERDDYLASFPAR